MDILELTCAYPCTYSVDLLLSWLGSELVWLWDGLVDLLPSRLESELAWVQTGLGALIYAGLSQGSWICAGWGLS